MKAMHEPAPDENRAHAAKVELADGAGKLDDRHFISRERFIEILGDAPRMDYKQFRADIDAYVDQDPTPRQPSEP
ncbi:MAG TPA: hypothetical protein VF731_09275 [Solirubrobacterales bacterium]